MNEASSENASTTAGPAAHLAPVDAWVVRLSSLGDIVHALPLRAALEALGLRVAWVVEARFARVMASLREPMPYLAWDRSRKGLRALAQGAAGARFALDVQGNLKSALVSRALRTRCRVAPARRDLREKAAFFVPAHARADVSAGPHILDRGLALVARVARVLGVEQPVDRAALGAPPFLERDPRALQTRLAREGLDLGEGSCVVVLQDPADPRSLPLELVQALAEERDVLCVAGPREAAVRWPSKLRVLRQAAGSLDELIALATLARQRGASVLAPDCGASHVMRAAGARVVFAFGPQDPARTGPIDAELAVERRPRLPCQPCIARACRLREGPRCMREIELASILDALDAASR